MQELKAVILSGGRLERETVLEQIGAIKPDCIIAADKGLEFCYNEGIRPDHIVGDFDSLNPEIIEWYRCEGKIPIDTYRPEKDMTDTDIAMEKAVHLGADAIYLFGVTGTRLDHTLSNIFNLYKLHAQGIRGEIIDAHNRIYIPTEKNCPDGTARPARQAVIKKSQQYGRFVSLFPLRGTVTGLTLTGFKYPVQDADMVQGDGGLFASNEITAEEGVIRWKNGTLLVMETRDRI